MQDMALPPRGMIDGVELPFDEGADGAMTFVHLFPWPGRIMIGFAGLIPLMAPYELLWKFGTPFQLGLLPFWIISAMAVSIGVPLLVGALLGLERRVVVDPARRAIRVEMRGPFSWTWEQRHGFDQIVRIAVRENDFSDGPPSFELAAVLHPRGRLLQLWSFAAADRAERVAEMVRARIDDK